MDTDGARRLNRSSPSCLNSGAQRTDFFHGLLVICKRINDLAQTGMNRSVWPRRSRRVGLPRAGGDEPLENTARFTVSGGGPARAGMNPMSEVRGGTKEEAAPVSRG